MQTLIFSDTHFTDEFEPARCNYMMKLIKKVDQVIINGDFFDHYMVDFDTFINSEWQCLFPLLKEKNAIYLYGNHDLEKMVNNKAELFSIKQTEKLYIKLGDKKILITHGHRIAPEIDDIFPRIIEQFKHLYPFFFNLEKSGSIIGKLYQYFKGIHYRYMMRKMQRHAHENMDEQQILMVGHSHFMIDDRANGFVNIGAFQKGWARYALFDTETGNIEFVEEPYEKLAEN